MQIAGNSSDLAVISVLSLPQLSHYNYNSVDMVVAEGGRYYCILVTHKLLVVPEAI